MSFRFSWEPASALDCHCIQRPEQSRQLQEGKADTRGHVRSIASSRFAPKSVALIFGGTRELPAEFLNLPPLPEALSTTAKSLATGLAEAQMLSFLGQT